MIEASDHSHGPFAPGRRVLILEGAFQGMEGTIISPEQAHALLPSAVDSPGTAEGKIYWLVVTIFGREVAIQQFTEYLASA